MAPNMVNLSALLMFISVVSTVNCHSMEDSKQLLADLKENYTCEFRPLRNQSETLDVFVHFELISIMEFDEVLETITVTGVLGLRWRDEYFSWDPNDYGGLEFFVTSTTNIWIPYILLTNAALEIDKISEDWHLLFVNHTGWISYYPGDIFSATCSIDVTYYPMDVQKCAFTFAPWGYIPQQLRLNAMHDSVQLNYFTANGAWTLVGSFTDRPYDTQSFVSFSLVLERKPLFVIVNVILPLTFMSFLNVLIFLLPSESGERMSYCITVLLAIAVFLTLVADNLPKTSSPMSIFSYYLLSVLVVSLCITLSTIFSLQLYHTDDSQRVGTFWRRLATCMKCKQQKKVGSRKNKLYVPDKNLVNNVSGMKRTEHSKDLHLGHYAAKRFYISSVPNRHVETPNVIERKSASTRSLDHPLADRHFPDTYTTNTENPSNDAVADICWKDVSVAVDKIAFLCFALLIVIDTVIFLITIWRGRYIEND